MDEDTSIMLAPMGLQYFKNKQTKKHFSLAPFGGCQGTNSLFWKLSNKGKELNIYFPFPGYTFII